jgi:hypothetical protein
MTGAWLVRVQRRQRERKYEEWRDQASRNDAPKETTHEVIIRVAR